MFEYLCDKSVDEFCPLLSDVHNPIRLTVSYNNRNFESTLADHDNDNCVLWDRYCPEKFVDNIDILKLCEIETKLENFSLTGINNKSEIDFIIQDISLNSR